LGPNQALSHCTRGFGAPNASICAGSTLLKPPHGLSGREIEVLRLIAAGKTNHAIAT
jgi:DNA-binding CsgD family transcriptional regulator